MKYLPAIACILMTSSAFAQTPGIKTPKRAIATPEQQQQQTEQTVQVMPPADTSVKVAPANCDFEVSFPGQPYSSRRCPDGTNGKCYDLTRYTMVYEMSTTVDVRFSCNPMTQTQYDQYSEDVTRMALNGMAARNNVTESTTNFTQENDVKRTTLSGSGTSGRQNKIYIAQLWLSPRSILTLEAELIGEEHGTADAVFSDILKSVKVKETAPVAQAPVETAPTVAPEAVVPAPAPAPAP